MQLTATFSRHLRFIIHFLGWIVHKIIGHDDINNIAVIQKEEEWVVFVWYRITDTITRVRVIHKNYIMRMCFFTPRSVSLNRSIDSPLRVLCRLRLPIDRWWSW